MAVFLWNTIFDIGCCVLLVNLRPFLGEMPHISLCKYMLGSTYEEALHSLHVKLSFSRVTVRSLTFSESLVRTRLPPCPQTLAGRSGGGG